MDKYKASGGNPWGITPSAFTTSIAADVEALYGKFGYKGYIKEIRDRTFSGSCPLCGSLHTGTLDHYLPKTTFPEFSIYSLNLIPACTHCNTGGKRATYKGAAPPARFIHPYFDTIGSKPIWLTTFKKPYSAAKIGAKPVPGIPIGELEVVEFHINNLLKKEFRKYTEHLWSKLPLLVSNQRGGSGTKTYVADTRSYAQAKLKEHEIANGMNSWPSGFYRGLLSDNEAIEFIATKAAALEAQFQLSIQPSSPS
jgi:hypothetical protein